MLMRRDSIALARGYLLEAAARWRSPREDFEPPLSFGIDLGTATVVLTAIDAAHRPVYWDSVVCEAVRDGVVVNFAEAVDTVRHLKQVAEDALGAGIESAGTAFPPNVPEADARACRFVLEKAELDCRVLLDEVSAAQSLLAVQEGALVDVGGGSTGVGIVEDGRITSLDDHPGGGHHLDLILAGALKLSIEEAEAQKRAGARDFLPILRPGIERIADTVRRLIGNRQVEAVHLVGGAVRVGGAPEIIARFTGIPTIAYPHCELITPFGIAAS